MSEPDSNTLAYKFIVVTVFAIAMGFLEAVVVVYLREIYYPDGFAFPLTMIEPGIFGVELVREITTLIMLVCIGLLAGRSTNERFAWFLFTFGVWDIFYYVGLKFFLDWPESLLSWDILFLIPVTWIGPVLAPVICSITMILFAVTLIGLIRKNKRIAIGKSSWVLIISGAVIIFISFIQDYSILLYHEGFLSKVLLSPEPGFIEAITIFVPDQFNWYLFGFGELIILVGITRIFIKYSLKSSD